MRQSVVSHAVVVHQIAVERGHVFFRAAMLQADFVIAPRVVHERIDPAKIFQICSTDCKQFSAVARSTVMSPQAAPLLPQFALQLFAGFRIAAHDHWNCTFGSAGANNRRADSLGSARDDDHFIFQLQVHALASQVEEAAIDGIVHARNERCFVGA